MTGTSCASEMLVLLDTNILSDIAQEDFSVFAVLVAEYGAVLVPRSIVDECSDVDVCLLTGIGIHIVEATPEQTEEAFRLNGERQRLSIQDCGCFVLCRDRGATCVTNDKCLKRFCEENGVNGLWEFQALIPAVRDGIMSADHAMAFAEGVARRNGCIPQNVVEAFREKQMLKIR